MLIKKDGQSKISQIFDKDTRKKNLMEKDTDKKIAVLNFIFEDHLSSSKMAVLNVVKVLYVP
jgi:hypothetical protein